MQVSFFTLFYFAILYKVYADAESESFLNWIKNNGGYIIDKVELSTGPDPNWTIRGVFATADIEEGEIIFTMGSDLSMCESDSCGLVKRLSTELDRNEQSFWWPYISMMKSHDIDLPSVWNDMEKALLDGIYPSDWTRHSQWLSDVCQLDMDNSNIKLALQLSVARAHASSDDSSCLSVFYDSLNHANGELLNTMTASSVQNGDHRLEIQATKKILKGQQVFNSFGENNVVSLFRDYGFITALPHIWVFEGDDEREYSISIDAQPDVNEGLVINYNPYNNEHQNDFANVYHQVAIYLESIQEYDEDIDEILRRYETPQLQLPLPDQFVGMTINPERLAIAKELRQELKYGLALALQTLQQEFNEDDIDDASEAQNVEL